MQPAIGKGDVSLDVNPKDIKKSDKGLGIKPRKRFWKTFKEQKLLYMMSLPFVAWVIVFKYVPLWGWTMAFQNYQPERSFWEQEWVGLDHFIELFQDDRFYLALRNTLAMSIMGLIVGFIVPIIFAILLNEVRLKFFKRTIQTVSYLPHFVSWVVAAGIVTKMLSIESVKVPPKLVENSVLNFTRP